MAASARRLLDGPFAGERRETGWMRAEVVGGLPSPRQALLGRGGLALGAYAQLRQSA
jgi:hypothetical protein